MNVYHSLKQLVTQHVLDYKSRLVAFNLKMNTRKAIREILQQNKTVQLSAEHVEAAKAYYKSKGYKLKHTYWHQYFTSINGEFYAEYIPDDIFTAIISPRFNQMRQWPALLDKNLTYNLFKDFKQPQAVVQNINGFFYVDDKIVSEFVALETCNTINKPLIIKPTIDSGDGKNVELFSVNHHQTSFNNLKTSELFRLYKKDFIVQECVEQSETMKALNPSSFNTIRLMTYLKEDGVHILSSVLRIGQPSRHTDNFSGGGIVCGIDNGGVLRTKGYNRFGDVFTRTPSNVVLDGFQIPNYQSVVEMVKAMHPIVPYFKLISWDIGIDINESPVFIEYNTYYQSTDLHQIANGPLFGAYTDEILEMGQNR